MSNNQEKLDNLADRINEELEKFLSEAKELAKESNPGALSLLDYNKITPADFLERVCRYVRRPFVKANNG